MIIEYNEWEILSEKKDFFEKHGIKRTASGVGFSEKEQKWYGWSHRGIYGFGVGDKVKKGHVAYEADNLDNFIEQQKDFWKSDSKKFIDHEIKGNKLYLNFEYKGKRKNESDKSLIDRIEIPIPKKWGRGEWVAKNLDDAKEMALAYHKGVD